MFPLISGSGIMLDPDTCGLAVRELPDTTAGCADIARRSMATRMVKKIPAKAPLAFVFDAVVVIMIVKDVSYISISTESVISVITFIS
jgi:hypothetical protein